MTIEEASAVINAATARMRDLYKQPVFDEWAILHRTPAGLQLVRYHGPREADFKANFQPDAKSLRAEVSGKNYTVGDFEFSRAGVGTGYDGMMVLGANLYLVCNNTRNSMDEITRDTLWLGAQVAFVDMADKFRANPLSL